MRYIVLLSVLSLFLAACSKTPTDAQIRQRVVSGSWNGDTNAVMVMSPDGSISQTLYNHGRTVVFEGTWQVSDDFLIFTMTNQIQGKLHAPIHFVRRFEVVHVDDHQLVYGPKGHTITLTR
jgi:hypothetical protein